MTKDSRSKPKLALPALKKPKPEPKPKQNLRFGEAMHVIMVQEIERVGRDRHAVFDAMMQRIADDVELHNRIAAGLITNRCRKLIKRKLRRLDLIRQQEGA